MLRIINWLFNRTTERSNACRPVDAGTNMIISDRVIAGRVLGVSLCVHYDQTFGHWCWEADDGRHRPMTGRGYDSWDKAWWEGVQSIEDWTFDG